MTVWTMQLCPTCAREFPTHPHWQNAKTYCSRDCANRAKIGKPRWDPRTKMAEEDLGVHHTVAELKRMEDRIRLWRKINAEWRRIFAASALLILLLAAASSPYADTRTVTWEPSQGAALFRVYYYKSWAYKRIKIAEGPSSSFQVAIPSGTHYWQVCDVLPNGTERCQLAMGWWTTAP